MKHRVIVGALIMDGDMVLIGRKPPGIGPYPDTWHIPGGGVKLGEETCDEAVKREIAEETGLSVKNLKKIGWDEDREPDKKGEMTSYIFLQYTCELSGGTLKPGDDMQHFIWVKRSDLGKYEHCRPSQKLFKRLGLL